MQEAAGWCRDGKMRAIVTFWRFFTDFSPISF